MESKNHQSDTHVVFNQPKPLENYNAFTADRILQYWVAQFGGQWGEDRLTSFGGRIGGDLLEAGMNANQYLPTFRPVDRFGYRIDQVDYHPAYHQLMAHAIEHGHCAMPWSEKTSGRHVVRAAMAFLHTHADPGSGCPLTMTFASVPALQAQADIAEKWLPKIVSGRYDGRNIPWFEKEGVTLGMAMTEKQGGSDVRANTTYATPCEAPGGGKRYSLVGHKWFCSAPMSDAFLVLAKTDHGLSCFLVPRWREDGSKNSIHIQRLKDKLGNQSNASSEIEFRDAQGWLLGEPGKGIKTIIQMVALTRYDCMIGSSALMAQATKEAIWHTAGREVFGKPLHHQPLMQNVLADLALESEAALAISMRLARALEQLDNPHEAALVRIGTAVGKYWICKRAVQHTYEAMECLGGVGYVNENVASRLYREAPVNAIWEGSGNVQCLDLLRVLTREPDTVSVFIAELRYAIGANDAFDRAVDGLEEQLGNAEMLAYRTRQVIEKMAILWQAATLLRYGEPDIAEAFVQARVETSEYHQYGTLPSHIDMTAIISRAMPQSSG
ncbi:DNA alkylation response protein [Salinivibrio kushneri]|uniref:DNA alkylation response protein n=1 Tax=Salinivibrio kushneri TaxID=1908198 RepID=A0AB36K2E7_9GAMM|nr:acyl-CoA dehydrogenase family protein [Salinivibrio kushneri]OOE41451.1 DNA alkylation response protein [Salinivibrio kushneri]QCP01998.1 DNA alkylation response protein [Salinivibrio kushneri]